MESSYLKTWNKTNSISLVFFFFDIRHLHDLYNSAVTPVMRVCVRVFMCVFLCVCALSRLTCKIRSLCQEEKLYGNTNKYFSNIVHRKYYKLRELWEKNCFQLWKQPRCSYGNQILTQ